MEEQYGNDLQLKGILIRLSEYKAYLLNKKSRIIGFSSIFFLIGVLIAINAEVKYNAELTFVVEGDKNRNSFGAMSGIASQLGFDLGGGSSSTFSQSNILEILKSRGVVEQTLMQSAIVNGKDDLLIEHYLELNGIKDLWLEDIDLKAVNFHKSRTYIHDSITGGIWRTVVEDQLVVELQSDEANIINLSYTSIDEEFSKQFVESLIDQMSRMYVNHQTAQANNTIDFLQNRADSVFSELEIAEEDFARIKDVNQRIVKASGRLKELQMMRRVEVLNTMYLEIVKNLEVSKMTLLNQTPIINILDTPTLPLEEDKKSVFITGFLACLLGGFLSVCFFVFRKFFKDALAAS